MILQVLFALAWWACLFTAAVLIGGALLWAYVLVDDWRLEWQRARRDREECARMESLRRMADWNWMMEPFRWDWAQQDWLRDVRALPEAEPRRVVR